MDQAIGNVFQWIEGSGLALALVVGLGWFLVWKAWPRYIARQDRLDKEAKERQDKLDLEEKQRIEEDKLESKRRHDEYMKVIADLSNSVSDFSTAMKAVNVTISSMAQMIGSMTDHMDDHHAEVMEGFKSIR